MDHGPGHPEDWTTRVPADHLLTGPVRRPADPDRITEPGVALPEPALDRLTQLSLEEGHPAAGLPWDDPDAWPEPDHPGWRLWSHDPLARTRWYRSLGPADQARVGRWRTAEAMRVGWEFENLLQRGLLKHAFEMSNVDPAFGYLHHEVMEESEHTLMFFEYVRRTCDQVAGMPPLLRRLGEGLVEATARPAPELFFLLVLGGELPIDHVQRLALRDDGERLVPVLAEILDIHVTEETRHVSFARHQLRARAPHMGRVRRRTMAMAAPVLLGIMSRLILFPSAALVRHFDVDRRELSRVLADEASLRLLTESCGRIHRQLDSLGLVDAWSRPLWVRAGLRTGT